MKYLTALLILVTILEFSIILGLYLRVVRMTAEIVAQHEQIEALQTDLHIILNDRDMCR